VHAIYWVSDSIYTPSDQISIIYRRSSLSMVMGTRITLVEANSL
jgi:hypothetical protein